MSSTLSFAAHIPVLDHGFVTYKGHLGTDEDVIEAARQSTGRGFEGWDKDEGLLDYLWRGNPVHGSVQEHNFLRVQVQLPIFVVREWHRHRTQSYNEMSGRYTQLPDLYYLPAAERIQRQSTKNKQGSGEAFDEEDAEWIRRVMEVDQRSLRDSYEQMLSEGVAREIARVNVPVSQYTRMWASGNMRNWFNFLDLRTRPDAQWEIRQYADAVEGIMRALWPRSWAMWREYVRDAVRLSASEAALVRGLIHVHKENFRAACEISMGPKKTAELLTKLGLTVDVDHMTS